MPLQLRRTSWGLLSIVVLLCLTWVQAGAAATPPAGSVGTATPRFDWAGQVYAFGTVFDVRQCQEQAADPANVNCDHVQLTAQNSGSVTVTINWEDPNDDFDLLVCRPGDDPGETPGDFFTGDECAGLSTDYVTVAAAQNFPPSTSESVTFMGVAGTTYEIRVVPFAVAGGLTTCPEVTDPITGLAAVAGYCGTATFQGTGGGNDGGGNGGGGIDPPVWISDTTVVEGDAGLPEAVFTLTMGWETAVPATVSFSTVDLTATGGDDYVPTTGQATFAPGTTRTTIRVPIRADLTDEADERFAVNLHVGTPMVVKIFDEQGVATIRDDDWRKYIEANVETADGRLMAWVRQGNAGRVYYQDKTTRFYGLWITKATFDDLTRSARIEGSGYKNGRRTTFVLETKDSAVGGLDSFTLTLGDGTTISPLLIKSGDIKYAA